MNAMLNMIGRRARVRHSRGRAFSLLVVLALLLQIGLPGSTGMQVAQAAGPGGPSGTITHTTAADFDTASCVDAGQTNTTVTNYNTDGEVRLLASLEDYFDGTEVDSNLWNFGPVNPAVYPQYSPTVAGGLVTLDGSYMQSTQLFNQSGRFMEAQVLMRANEFNTTYVDVGFYRANPPMPPSTVSPITADTAVRLFLTTNSGTNDLLARLADGTVAFVDNLIAEPDMRLWHIYRINWGAEVTDFLIDGSSLTTMTEQDPGGDTLGARVLFYHQEPSPNFPTIAPMQVDWIRAGQYPATGTYDSCIYDATGIVNFRNASWLADVPGGSGLTIQTRTAQDNPTTWSAWSTPIDAAALSATLNSPSGRYFQYRLNFTSSSLIQSAELRQMQVNYYGPTSIDITPASPTVNPGATQQFTATVSDGLNPITGLTVTWSVTGTGNGSINSTGLYTAPFSAGTYTDVVNASVNLFPSGTLSDTASVTVPNLPPLAEAGGPYTGPEGSVINLLGTGSDPNGGTVTFAWDLDNNGSFEINSQNTTFTRNDNGGPFTVVLRVTDNLSLSTTDSTTVTVTNVAPTATFNASTPVNEGGSVNLSLTNPFDPSTADTIAGFEYAFNCGSGTFSSYSSSSSASCPTTDNGTLAVGGRIRDKDMGVSTYTANVTVASVAPTATFNAPTSVNEGSPVNLSLTSPSDPSSADTNAGFEYAFNCGSGYSSYSTTITSMSCPTTNNTTLAVGGRIRDKDMGVTEYLANVTVANVAPTAGSFNIAPPSIDEGGEFTLTLEPPYFDPSTVDTAATFTFAFDCGSGTFSPESSTNSITCQTIDDGTLDVRGRIMDVDGGNTIYTGSILVGNVAPVITSVTNNGPVFVGVAAQITVTVTSIAGDVLTYEFDCDNDGTYEVGPQSSNVGACTFDTFGQHTVQVRVNDDDGSSDTETTIVDVNEYYLFLPLTIKGP